MKCKCVDKRLWSEEVLVPSGERLKWLVRMYIRTLSACVN